MKCRSCEMLSINGVACHEMGCPDAWNTGTRDCKECGVLFKPEFINQQFCSDECFDIHHGFDIREEEEEKT